MVFVYESVLKLRYDHEYPINPLLVIEILKTNFIVVKNQGSLSIKYTKSVHIPFTPHSVYPPLILSVYILYTFDLK